MSVAFRRESDEEHLEPKFERPIPPGPNLVTPRGLAEIAARVAALEPVVAGAAADALPAERRDLRYWRARLATARIAPEPAAGVAGIGSRVRFRLNGTARVIEIVGADEADPARDRIAYTAPLARALIGTSAGEQAAFGGAEDAIEVIGVERVAST